jgi:hypothetical protein
MIDRVGQQVALVVPYYYWLHSSVQRANRSFTLFRLGWLGRVSRDGDQVELVEGNLFSAKEMSFLEGWKSDHCFCCSEGPKKLGRHGGCSQLTQAFTLYSSF